MKHLDGMATARRVRELTRTSSSFLSQYGAVRHRRVRRAHWTMCSSRCLILAFSQQRCGKAEEQSCAAAHGIICPLPVEGDAAAGFVLIYYLESEGHRVHFYAPEEGDFRGGRHPESL